MVYTERDVLLRPGKIQSKRKTWIGLLLSVTLVSLVMVLAIVHFVFTSTDSTNGLLTATENNQNCGSGQRSTNPIVKTSLGSVKGLTLTSRGGRDYKAFYNLPYAEPPIGNLRFKPPIPAVSWSGMRDGTAKGSMCVQKSRYNPDAAVEGTEDCLHVNLCTPKLPARRHRNTDLMPVIVYFLGGRFVHGAANDFGCDYFMDEDVVMVIPDSRVGALGFLNTGDMEAPGNMGLKDQNMALRWVQENIDAFGGDPKRVVAFGTSSGGMSAHAHLLSPMSNGLLSGVISVSGTMFTPGAFSTDTSLLTESFATALNCSSDQGSKVMMQCLRNVSAWDIGLDQSDFSPSLEQIPSNGDISDVFFPETPVALTLSGQAHNIPWLTGVNSAELMSQAYSMLLDEEQAVALNNNWMKTLSVKMSLSDSNQSVVDEVTRQIHDFYFGNKTISRSSDTRFNLSNLFSDRTYYHPARTAGLQHAQNNSVYFYYLTKEANVSYSQLITQNFDPPYGVAHADEVQYFFYRTRYPYIGLDSPWADISVLLVKLWVSFASTGVPVNPDPNGVPWPAVDLKDDGMLWYNLDDEPKLIEPFTERMRFFDSLPFDLLYNTYNFPRQF